MTKATVAIKYEHRELAELMVKDQGIKKGHWMIQASYTWAATNVVGEDGGPSGPGAISVLTNIGIQELDEPGPFTVDASTLWEKKPARKRQRATPKKRRGAPAGKARA